MTDKEKEYLDSVTITPADTTLDDSYVALQPGNYKPKTNLKPYKGKNINPLTYKPKIPFGVGDSDSVVFIYLQGTIEIVGQVYCWNKLIKPGIYSQWDKLRFLEDNTEIPTRSSKTQYGHHTAYNRTVTVPANPYVQKRSSEAETILQYRYVSFDEAIVSKEGEAIYPIPIVNGTLTIYPDGTFTTKGVVVDSKESKLIDRYGYLNDQDNYSSIETFFDSITKDDINPKNVYKLISENEDGSTTYGPIEANENITRSHWFKIPEDIIPIMDGQVTVNEYGYVSLSGTVITSKGYRIKPDYFQISDFRDNIDNDDWVDHTRVYNPLIWSYPNNREVMVKIVSPGNTKKIYKYHYFNESMYLHENDTGPVVTYKPMPGWDKFQATSEVLTTDKLETYIGTISLVEFNGSELTVDKSRYPYTTKCIQKVGSNYRYPQMRLNEHFEKEIYSIIDHRYYYGMYDDVTSTKRSQTIKEETNSHYLWDNEEIKQFISNENKFVPYTDDNGKTSYCLFTKDEDGQVWFEYEGNVIWKRDQQYLRLQNHTGSVKRVKFDLNWPDIKTDENGNYVSLFTVNGYFTDEPIFINKQGEGVSETMIGNDYVSIDGVRRQEEGLFTEIERDVTAYLTSYEKLLIDNDRGHYITVVSEADKAIFHHLVNYKLNQKYTSKDSNMDFCYRGFRFQEVLPHVYGVDHFSMGTSVTDENIQRQFVYDRNQEKYLPYMDTYFSQIEGSNIFNTRLMKLDAYTEVKNPDDDNKPRVKMVKIDSLPEVHHFEVSGKKLGNDTYCNKAYHFNVRNRWTVSKGRLAITGTPNLELYYRYSDDLKTISGTIVLDSEGIYQMTLRDDLPRYSYIEFFIDDPFHDKGNIKRCNLKRNGDLEDIVIVQPKEVSVRTTEITGTAEPSATLRLYSVDDPNTVILTGRVNSNGYYKLENVTGLVVYKQYRLVEDDGFGNTKETTFIVQPYKYQAGDFITPLELFGMDTYLYPVNIRNVNNLDADPNLVDSALTINPKNQTYTIHGVFRDDKLKIWEEGTYNIGTKPKMYNSNLLGKTALDTKYQYTYKGKGVYKVGTTFKARSQDTLKLERTTITGNELQNEKWIIPREWLSDIATMKENNELNEVEKAIFSNMTDGWGSYFRYATGVFGRYQNKVVFDSYFALRHPDINGSWYVVYQGAKEAVDGIYNGYRKEGFTAREFKDALLKDNNGEYINAWFKYYNVGTTETSKFLADISTIDYSSYTTPVNRKIPAFALMNIDHQYTCNGLFIGTPTRFGSNYQMSIFNLGNWDDIIGAKVYDNEPNLIYYLVDYSYDYYGNYEDQETKMDDIVYEHWKSKGLQPDRYSGSELNATGRTIYSRDGKTAIVDGLQLMDGIRYIKPGRWTVSHADELPITFYWPDAYIVNTGHARYMAEKDAVEIKGTVYARNYNTDTGEYEDLPLLYPNPIAKIKSFKVESKDTPEWKTHPLCHGKFENKKITIDLRLAQSTGWTSDCSLPNFRLTVYWYIVDLDKKTILEEREEEIWRHEGLVPEDQLDQTLVFDGLRYNIPVANNDTYLENATIEGSLDFYQEKLDSERYYFKTEFRLYQEELIVEGARFDCYNNGDKYRLPRIFISTAEALYDDSKTLDRLDFSTYPNSGGSNALRLLIYGFEGFYDTTLVTRFLKRYDIRIKQRILYDYKDRRDRLKVSETLLPYDETKYTYDATCTHGQRKEGSVVPFLGLTLTNVAGLIGASKKRECYLPANLSSIVERIIVQYKPVVYKDGVEVPDYPTNWCNIVYKPVTK